MSGKWSAASPCWLKGVSKAKAAPSKAKGSVKVTWKADKAATGGFKVFVYAKKGGKVVKTKAVKAGATPATVKGLKSGRAYYVPVVTSTVVTSPSSRPPSSRPRFSSCNMS